MPLSMTYRAAPRITELGEGFYDEVAAARFPRREFRFPQRPLGRRESDSANSRIDEWEAHFADSNPFPTTFEAPRPPLPRPSVRRVQPEPRRRARLPLRASSRRPRAAARPRDQGQRTDAVVARRRRTAHAEGRRARSARHRNARGARRRDVEDRSACSRPARRSFAATSLRRRVRRCSCVSAIRTSASARSSGSRTRATRRGLDAAPRTPSSSTTFPELAGAPDRVARPSSARWRSGRAALAASWMAAGFVHGVLNTDNMNDHRRELRLRPLPLPPHLRSRFVAAYFDIRGSTRSGSSLAPSSATSCASPTRFARSHPIRRSPRPSRTSPRCSRSRSKSASSRVSDSCPTSRADAALATAVSRVSRGQPRSATSASSSTCAAA